MKKPYTFTRYFYHGKEVLSVFFKDEGIGSMEFKDSTPGYPEHRDLFFKFIDDMNDLHDKHTKDKGGAVR